VTPPVLPSNRRGEQRLAAKGCRIGIAGRLIPFFSLHYISGDLKDLAENVIDFFNCPIQKSHSQPRDNPTNSLFFPPLTQY
jgi:hypothetical protein